MKCTLPRRSSLWLAAALFLTLGLVSAALGGAGSPQPPLDVAEGDASTGIPIKKSIESKNLMTPGAAIEPKPTAGVKPTPPAAKKSLAEFLESELGKKKFHRRSAWAGEVREFQPLHDASRVWQSIGDVQFVTVHHATGVPNEPPAKMIRRVFNGHTSQRDKLAAADVGYHFFVDRTGEVWEGRTASNLGTHVGSSPKGLNNIGNLGVCGLGTFAREYPPKAMSESMIDLCILIAKYYGHPVTVRGHNDWFGIHGFNPKGGTDCPGHLEETVVKKAGRAIAGALAPKGTDRAIQSANPPLPVVRASAESAGPASPPEPPKPAAPTLGH